MRLDTVDTTVPLRAIELGQTLVDANSIVDVRELIARNFAPVSRGHDQATALSHEVGMIDRVLGNAMSGLRPIEADECRGWPPVLMDDLTQTRRIRIVNSGHPRMVPPGIGPISSQFGTDCLIMIVHRDEFRSQLFVQRSASRGVTTRVKHDHAAKYDDCAKSTRPHRWNDQVICGHLTPAILLRRAINNAAGERSEPAASVTRRQQQLLR